LIKIAKSVYDKPEAADGERILVMRIWPRGVSREKKKIDSWIKDLGTERDLIKKWKSGKIGWKEFASEYMRSLKGKEDLLQQLADKSSEGTITLLCTDKDPARCHRSLLAGEIEKFSRRRSNRK
jgi:uncharacterized protein YeaO (DUF488 family)